MASESRVQVFGWGFLVESEYADFKKKNKIIFSITWHIAGMFSAKFG